MRFLKKVYTEDKQRKVHILPTISDYKLKLAMVHTKKQKGLIA